MNLGFGGGGSEFQIPVLSAIVGMIADLMRIGLQISQLRHRYRRFDDTHQDAAASPRSETDPFHESDAGNTAGDPENPEEVQK